MSGHITKINPKTLMAAAALAAAIFLGVASFKATTDITANMLLLVAQFLLYSLTLMGFGEIVKFITKNLRK